MGMKGGMEEADKAEGCILLGEGELGTGEDGENEWNCHCGRLTVSLSFVLGGFETNGCPLGGLGEDGVMKGERE